MRRHRNRRVQRLECGCTIHNGIDLAPCAAHRADDEARALQYKAERREALDSHATHMEAIDRDYKRC